MTPSGSGGRGRRNGRVGWPSVVGLSVLTLTACADVRRVLDFGQQVEQGLALSRIEGRIEIEPPHEGVLVVILGRLVVDEDAGGETLVGADSYVRTRPGSFVFQIAPGRFQLGAYEDRNANGLLDPGERGVRVREGGILELGPGETARVDLSLERGTTIDDLEAPLDVLGLVERTPDEQREFGLWALSAHGRLCEDLSDDRFGPSSGPRGLWEPMDFLNDGLAGIYFLEAYDPDRVPVLFVHGISGYPQEFTTLIDRLDRSRFQPWFYFYPSSARLGGVAEHLAALLDRVHAAHPFDELAIVAHSMGGLVARGAILDYARDTRRSDVGLLLSLATPWGGESSAVHADRARIELPRSFADMSPTSDYLREIFYLDEARTQPRPLPAGVDFHMIIGFHMSRARDEANDGRVAVASQALPEAQEQAASVRAWDHDHAGILHAPEVVERMNRLLRERFD